MAVNRIYIRDIYITNIYIYISSCCNKSNEKKNYANFVLKLLRFAKISKYHSSFLYATRKIRCVYVRLFGVALTCSSRHLVIYTALNLLRFYIYIESFIIILHDTN